MKVCLEGKNLLKYAQRLLHVSLPWGIAYPIVTSLNVNNKLLETHLGKQIYLLSLKKVLGSQSFLFPWAISNFYKLQKMLQKC